MRVELSDTAKLDLQHIGAHYAVVGGAALAHRMVGNIKKDVLALANNPFLAPSYELFPGLRRLVVAKGLFLAFYRVNTGQEGMERARIEVVHVRRAERELYQAGAPDSWN